MELNNHLKVKQIKSKEKIDENEIARILTTEKLELLIINYENNSVVCKYDGNKIILNEYPDEIKFEDLKNETKNVTENLISKNIKVSTMESCTSGLIASTITDVEGASAILKGSAITYSNECKILEGVPKETIEKFGVYSKETAIDMAKAAKIKYGSDLSIGVTGSTGNIDINNLDSKVGHIYYCINYNKIYTSKIIFISTNYSRKEMKQIIVDIILQQVNNLI